MTRWRYTAFFAVVVLVWGLTSCGWTNRQTVMMWLDTAPQQALYDFSGEWYGIPSKSRWVVSSAPMQITQDGTRIVGTYDEYAILGVVNGDRIVLFGLWAEVVYYTWHLKLVPATKELEGRLCGRFVPELKETKCYSAAFR